MCCVGHKYMLCTSHKLIVRISFIFDYFTFIDDRFTMTKYVYAHVLCHHQALPTAHDMVPRRQCQCQPQPLNALTKVLMCFWISSHKTYHVMSLNTLFLSG